MKIIRKWALLLLVFFFSLIVGATRLAAAGPVFSVSPGSATFSVQTVGTSAPSMVLNVSNTGDSDLVISNVAVSGTNSSDFSFVLAPSQRRPSRSSRGAVVAASVPLPYTIPAGKSTAVLVAFAPKGSGSRSATLTFTHNAPGTPSNVALSGTTNSAGVSINPPSVNFGTQFVDSASNPTPITVTNNGTGTLLVSDLGISGANKNDFSMTLSAPPQAGRRPHRAVNVALAPTQSATLNVAFRPTATGARNASITLTDNAGGSPQSIPLSGTGSTPLGHFSISNVNLGANLEKLISVTVDNPPPSELPVTITSSDASKVVLSTDTNGTTGGTGMITSSIHSGADSIFPGFYVQAVGSSGTAQLTVSSPGYVSATSTVTIGPSGFVLIGPDGTTSDFETFAGSENTSLTVAVKELDLSHQPVNTNPPARIRGGLTVNVPVTSGTPATGTILDSPSQFTGAGSNGSSISFQPLAVGSTELSLGQPDVQGFTTPASGTSLTATVTPPVILLNPATVGSNLQVLGSARLSTPAPAGGLVVTITSSDPSKVLLSTDMSGFSQGSESIMLTVPEGQGAPAGFPGFIVQGLASSGTVQLTATANGYQNGTANVALTPSAFLIDGGKGNGQDFNTTPISADTPLKITATRLDPQLNPASTGTVRGGIFVSVPITSENTAIGDVNSPSAVFIGGYSTNSDVGFHPVADGTTRLAVQQPDGSSNPASGGHLNAIVGPPAIALNLPVSKIGRNLQISGFGSLNAPAPSGGMDVTITSSDSSKVLLSTTANGAGSSTITVNVPEGKGVNGVGFPTFYIQALSASGGATISASSTGSGFASTSTGVTLAPSGFVLTSPNGLGQDFATLHNSGNTTNLTVTAYQLNVSTLAPETPEAVRGGTTPNVTITLGTPAAGTITPNPAVFSGGLTNVVVGFVPGANVSSSTITATPPSGFVTPSSASTLNVNVN